jgi:hypothetical protein
MFPSLYLFLLTVVLGRLFLRRPVKTFLGELVILSIITILCLIQFVILHIMFGIDWSNLTLN